MSHRFPTSIRDCALTAKSIVLVYALVAMITSSSCGTSQSETIIKSAESTIETSNPIPVESIAEIAPKHEASQDSLQNESAISRSLTAHFARYEIKPTQSINNQDLTRDSERPEQVIKIGGNIVEWLEKIDEKGIRTAGVGINGDHINFEGEKTINKIDEGKNIGAEWANRWEQIRLYKLDDREILGIEMNQFGCTGLGCSVSIQLIYDLKTKTRNFFGTFRTESEIRLFRFGDRAEYFYVARTCECVNADDKRIVTYNPYRHRQNGSFEIVTALSGEAYFIEHTYFPEDVEPYTLKRIPSAHPDTLEHKWIAPIIPIQNSVQSTRR